MRSSGVSGFRTIGRRVPARTLDYTRGMTRALVLAAAGALAVAPVAASHGGSAQRGYVSTVASLRPGVLGVTVGVLGGDDRLVLRNWSGKTVVVLGYDGEPYLRFSEDGVYRNARSPATYLNRVRYPSGPLPPAADPEAPPEWVEVGDGNSFSWHDHRIHWARRTPPPGVRAQPDRIQRIFSWAVPATVGGEPFAIEGFLGYAPPAPASAPEDGGGFAPGPAAVTGLAALLALLAGLPLVLLRRRDGGRTTAVRGE